MKTKKQFFFMRAAMTLLVMLCSLGAWADDSGSCGTNVTYSYVESTHTLTISGTGDMENYDSSDIPWKDYKVGITSVVIGEGVTSIGNNAFQNCTNLSSVTIPTSVTSIGNNAFMSCTNLSSVTIPASVTSIGNNAFQNCTSLSYVTIPASVTSIGNYAFAGCTSLSSITIPASVTSIKPNVFYGCTNLSSVTIPTSVTSIGGAAFSGCTSLSSVTIPASVTSIGQAVFHSCTSLSSVTIPASVTSIQDNVFHGCTSLSSVTIPASVTSIGNYAFQNSGLTAVSFAEGSKLNTIGGNAFQNCTNLSSVTIPSSVTSIGNNAFQNSGLTAVSFAEGSKLNIIGNNAFQSCTSLTSATIPAGVTKIDQGAFYGCTSLTSIIVYATNPPRLGANAVASNASGRKIYVPKDYVGNYKNKDDWSAYSDAIEANPIEVSGTCGRTGHENEVTWLLTGTPGNFLLTISGTGDMENYDSSDIPWKDYKVGITSVMIGEGVTSIGECAFCDCEVLTSIAIPAGVTSIGKHAFDGCSNLATVTVYAPECSLGDYAFYGCDKLANIYVFSDKVASYQAAWSDYANKITAMTPVASGTCGKETPEDVTWRLEGEAGHYRLFISGTGEMADYDNPSDQPWNNNKEYIKTVLIENGVTSIGEGAFEDCEKLTSISIPSSVTSIGNYAFDGCSNLTTVTIPSSVTSIGEGAFNDCEKLTTVSIPASVTSIGNYAFGYCSALTSIEIPASVTTIGEEAFNNTALTSIEIPASVTSIGNGVFIGCEKLKSITVAEGNANYSNDTNGALFNKDKTTLIKYPKGNNADSYEIPASVTSICEKAFAGCEDLETVTLPPNVTSIGDDAFNNTALTSIEIPASVTSIGKGAFHLCSSLASVTLNSNPTIGEEAFFYNTTVTMNLAAAEVDGAKWTTFYNNYGNFQADENTEVYKGTVSGSELVLTPISDKIVNAGNAVILKSKLTDNPVPVMTLTTTNSSDDFTDNALKGLSVRTLASEVKTNYSASTIYVMGNTTKNGFGFHKYTGEYMPANKAFLALGSGSSAPLRMVIDDDEETTGIASMTDGIDDMSDVWYTLDGRKLNGKPTTKGLYIVNGKKVMIK